MNSWDPPQWKEAFAEVWLNDEWVKVEVVSTEGTQKCDCLVERCDGSGAQFWVKAGELVRFGSHDLESEWEIWKREEFGKVKELLNEKGFHIEREEEDGNCLFRAVARQVYGNPEKFQKVRDETVDYIITRRSYFSGFEPNIDVRLSEQLINRSWGGHLEIAAMSDLYNVGIVV